jgi:hypothetical protein
VQVCKCETHLTQSDRGTKGSGWRYSKGWRNKGNQRGRVINVRESELGGGERWGWQEKRREGGCKLRFYQLF